MEVRGFEEIQARVRETMLRLPAILGNAAVNWAVDSFRVQGWRDRSKIGTAWPSRSAKEKSKRVRALLIKTGRLRRSIRILSLTENSVTFGSDVPYAEVHNKGFNGIQQVKAHTRGGYGKKKLSEVKSFSRNMNIPRRQYMPTDDSDSPVFKKEMEDIITNELKPLFNR